MRVMYRNMRLKMKCNKERHKTQEQRKNMSKKELELRKKREIYRKIRRKSQERRK